MDDESSQSYEVLEKCSLEKSIFSKSTRSEEYEANNQCSEAIGDTIESSPKILVPIDGKIWKSISARTPKCIGFHCPNFRESCSSGRLTSCEFDPISYFLDHDDKKFYARALINGIIDVRTRNNVQIEMTLDRALRVFVPSTKILLTVSNSAAGVSLLHPNGRVSQNNSRVDLMVNDIHSSNKRYAKLWFKGISFTYTGCPIVYLIDAAGVRSTTDKFPEITEESANENFLMNSQYGHHFFERATKMLEGAKEDERSTEINHVRIVSTDSDIITIHRPNNKCTIKINQKTGSVAVTTSIFHCTASMGPAPHLFIKRGDRRIHFDGSKFCCRNGGHSAGFDGRNQFRIFT